MTRNPSRLIHEICQFAPKASWQFALQVTCFQWGNHRLRDLRGEAGVTEQERQVGAHGLPIRQLIHALEQERGQRLTADASLLRLARGLFLHGVNFLAGDFILGGDRPADQNGGGHPELPMRAGEVRGLLRRVDAGAGLESAAAREEGGELVRAVAQRWDAVRLEHLQRGRQVQNGFGARADDDHPRGCQRLQVGRDVEAGLPMDAADPARGEDPNPDFVGSEHRPRDGRPAAGFFDDGRGEVAAADLHRRGGLREFGEFRVREADADGPVEDADRGGRRAVGEDGRLHVAAQREVGRMRESVREDGRLERDDGSVLFQGALDVVLDDERRGEGIHQITSCS